MEKRWTRWKAWSKCEIQITRQSSETQESQTHTVTGKYFSALWWFLKFNRYKIRVSLLKVRSSFSPSSSKLNERRSCLTCLTSHAGLSTCTHFPMCFSSQPVLMWGLPCSHYILKWCGEQIASVSTDQNGFWLWLAQKISFSHWIWSLSLNMNVWFAAQRENGKKQS